MNTRNFHFALLLTTLSFSLFSCAKTEETLTPVEVKSSPVIPTGDLIRIHFGTSTQNGCLYSFSNCIWIGWGASAANYDARMAMQFDQGDEAGNYFGQYFPLTSDYTVDEVEAKALGIEPQVIPAGFYPLRDVSTGQATGRRSVVFLPEPGLQTGSLLNPNNPQDNLGQLHNLAVQVVLHENHDAIQALNGDHAAIQKLVTEKTIQFLAEAEVPVSAEDQKRAFALNLDRDFGDYAARLEETSLSANDKKVLLGVFNEAAAVTVNAPADLKNFVNLMTEQENRLSHDAKLDNPKLLLSMVSVLKNSRYFWYWKSISSPDGGAGTVSAGKIPDWVWADIIGMELGGPVGSAIASTLVYLDQR